MFVKIWDVSSLTQSRLLLLEPHNISGWQRKRLGFRIFEDKKYFMIDDYANFFCGRPLEQTRGERKKWAQNGARSISAPTLVALVVVVALVLVVGLVVVVDVTSPGMGSRKKIYRPTPFCGSVPASVDTVTLAMPCGGSSEETATVTEVAVSLGSTVNSTSTCCRLTVLPA